METELRNFTVKEIDATMVLISTPWAAEEQNILACVTSMRVASVSPKCVSETKEKELMYFLKKA